MNWGMIDATVLAALLVAYAVVVIWYV